MSEVFLIAWQRICDVPEPALPWLLTVARNTGLSQFRAAARQQSIATELAAWASEAEADVAVLAVEGKGSAVFSSQGYLGPSYPGQIGRYEVVVSDAWTNMAPALPPRSARTGPNGQRG